MREKVMAPSPVERAQQHLSRGETQLAVQAIEVACADNDAAALFLAAIWRLVGDPLPRDLSRARGLLEQARRAGHADAALMEIALTANGTGAASDWAQALHLLETAAATDNVAAGQLTLIHAMNLRADGFPATLPQAERLCDSPLVEIYRAALSPQECEHVARTVSDIIAPSVVVDPASGRQILHPVRQSDGAVVGPTRESLVVGAINRRIAALTGTRPEQGEPLQVLRYGPGQQYRLHSDALPGVTNQRSVTAIAYLNSGYAGGETDFPEIGVRYRPQGGDILVFHNVLADGRMDPRARHAGLPVTSGVKWIATRWIHTAPYDPWTAS
jgi:prolyl 4-hydroxylase